MVASLHLFVWYCSNFDLQMLKMVLIVIVMLMMMLLLIMMTMMVTLELYCP